VLLRLVAFGDGLLFGRKVHGDGDGVLGRGCLVVDSGRAGVFRDQ
jgi:hypothetical protein